MFPKVIVSLTTYPARLKYVRQAIEPLFHQTVEPDEVQLWLSKDEFFFRESFADGELEKLAQCGVMVKWCEGNLKSHKKYFGVLQEYPDDLVITVDDDLIYPLTLIQSLLESHYLWPEAIIASRTHMVKTDERGDILPYGEWLFEQHVACNVARHDLIATSGAGTLFPSRCFDASVFDLGAITECAPLADDLWLMVHAMRQGVPVVNTAANTRLSYLPETQNEGLYIENLEGGGNDLVLRSLFERYPEVEANLRSLAYGNEASAHRGITCADAEHPSALRRLVRRMRDRA